MTIRSHTDAGTAITTVEIQCRRIAHELNKRKPNRHKSWQEPHRSVPLEPHKLAPHDRPLEPRAPRGSWLEPRRSSRGCSRCSCCSISQVESSQEQRTSLGLADGIALGQPLCGRLALVQRTSLGLADGTALGQPLCELGLAGGTAREQAQRTSRGQPFELRVATAALYERLAQHTWRLAHDTLVQQHR